jgi:hypothetical protein
MTKAKRRRLALIHILSDLSRDGWKNARYEDYAPLEKELREIEAQDSERHAGG